LSQPPTFSALEKIIRSPRGLSLDPEDSLAIEDSPSGVASARVAGCCVFAVTTTHPEEALAGAHRVFTSTIEALDAASGGMRLPLSEVSKIME